LVLDNVYVSQEKGKKDKQPRPDNFDTASDQDTDMESGSDSDASFSEDGIAAYERKPRQAAWNREAEEAERTSLPIKLADGSLRPGAILKRKSMGYPMSLCLFINHACPYEISTNRFI
jgi:hypothetical protein